jgi:beta-lactam-binding protein with PASTA domain
MSTTLVLVGVVVAIGCGVSPANDKAIGSDGKVAVPDLVNDTMDTVYDQLQDAHLVAKAATPVGVSDWTKDAVVLSTSPAAGVRVPPNSTVKIVEATKAEILFFSKPMPDLVGRRWLDAASDGMEAAYPYVEASWREPKGREEAGTIVAQKPSPGAKLKLGQTLRVTVANYSAVDSNGGSTIDVPDVNWPNVCRHTRWC